MREKITYNQWKVSGDVFRINELQGEFSASVRIRGIAKRPDVFSSNILEFVCLLTPRVYDEAKRLGMERYRSVTMSGHLESWDRGKGSKVYFIADKIENVGGFEL